MELDYEIIAIRNILIDWYAFIYIAFKSENRIKSNVLVSSIIKKYPYVIF